MPRIGIVTDTSSDLSLEEASETGIRLVPLQVSFGEESFEALTELSNEAFYERLTAAEAPFPRTAAPNPGAFGAVYREMLDDGADGVVCITLSARLSATHQSAITAAEAFPGRVRVVDSMTTTHTLGLIARAAAHIATTGATIEEVEARATDLRGRADILFVVDTLEYLQKGGRIGRASALLGTALAVKPILRVEDGVVATADKRRTMAKARARLLELVAVRSIERAVVLHTMSRDVEAFRDEVAAATGLATDAIGIGLVGPVAGAHVGPGIYGVSTIAAS